MSTSDFDDAANAAVVFRLYVAGEAPNSIQALRNLQALCQQYLADAHQIEVVDVLLSPQRAWTEGIVVTPTLVRLAPAPRVQIIGNLNNTGQVCSALGFDPSDHD